jgi:hypothetical protein
MLATRTVRLNRAIPAPKVERNGMFEGSDRGFLYECQISSAVSTVLRVQSFGGIRVSGAEQCGYGDLQ